MTELQTKAAQLLATTHSPLLLTWLKPEEHQTTFLCKRVSAYAVLARAKLLPVPPL